MASLMSARSGCSRGNFAPAGWMFCDGQLLPISENETLFQLIGTTYGGDGEVDVRAAQPAEPGADPPGTSGCMTSVGETGGVESVTLTIQQIPIHTHPMLASTNPGIAGNAAGQRRLPARPSINLYIEGQDADVSLNAQAVGSGRRQPAAREHAALSLRQLHHLAVRHLPAAQPRRALPWPIPSSPKSASFRSISPPKGWAFCNGQLLPLSQNTALFSLLGTTYGGDGKSTFALPDLQGSAPLHPGQGQGLSDYDLGQTGGASRSRCSKARCQLTPTPSGRWAPIRAICRSPTVDRNIARSGNGFAYVSGPLNAQFAPQALALAGGSLPHNNMMPYLTLNFCIALQGVFPPRP